jgi:hypothetical protein
MKLNTPQDEQEIQDTHCVVVNWKPISNTKEYLVQISSKNDFSDTVQILKTSDSTLISSPLPKGIYYSRIKAQNNYSDWSEWLKVFTFSIKGPDTPKLVSPVDTVYNSPSNELQHVTFTWHTALYAINYEIQVSKHSNFSSVEFNETLADTQQSVQLPIGRYFWRIRSINSSAIIGEWGTGANVNIGVFRKEIGDKDYESAFDAIQLNDGGYIILGSTNNYGEDEDILLTKLSSNGNVLWEKHIGGSKLDEPGKIELTSDNSLIIIGTSRSYSSDERPNVYIVKTDLHGTVLWTKNYQLKYRDFGKTIKENRDGGFIIGTYSFPAKDHQFSVESYFRL